MFKRVIDASAFLPDYLAERQAVYAHKSIEQQRAEFQEFTTRLRALKESAGRKPI